MLFWEKRFLYTGCGELLCVCDKSRTGPREPSHSNSPCKPCTMDSPKIESTGNITSKNTLQPVISSECDNREIWFISEIRNMMLSQVHNCVRSLQCCCDDDDTFYLEMLEFMENITICLFEKEMYHLLARNQVVIEKVRRAISSACLSFSLPLSAGRSASSCSSPCFHLALSPECCCNSARSHWSPTLTPLRKKGND